VKELEESFAQLPQEKAVPERLLRSQQALVQSTPAENESEDVEMGKLVTYIFQLHRALDLRTFADEGDAPQDDEDDTSALDLLDPVDILSKVPPNFFELLVGLQP
jgi:hypothetical protein